MAERNRASADSTQNTMKSAAVTPSEDTERPDGLAFDVEKGADLPGVLFLGARDGPEEVRAGNARERPGGFFSRRSAWW